MIKKTLLTLWSLIRGKRYISNVLMIGVSAWWDEDSKSVRSFQQITRNTAIGALVGTSAKIFLPHKVRKTAFSSPHDLTVIYQADVTLHTIMMKFDLEKWVIEVDKNPFV